MKRKLVSTLSCGIRMILARGPHAYASVRPWENKIDGEWLQDSRDNLLKYLYLYYKFVKVKEPLLFHKTSHLCFIILIAPCCSSTILKSFIFCFTGLWCLLWKPVSWSCLRCKLCGRAWQMFSLYHSFRA